MKMVINRIAGAKAHAVFAPLQSIGSRVDVLSSFS